MKIVMAFFGDLSCNRYKISGTRCTKPKVKKWMAVLASVIRGFSEDLELPITIKLAGNFKDERYPDLSNLHKVIGDAVEMGLGINDKYYKFVDGDVTLGALTPTVEIEILGTNKPRLVDCRLHSLDECLLDEKIFLEKVRDAEKDN